jgi:hypothetical protein
MNFDKILDGFFDAAWLEEADRLVARYNSRVEMSAKDLANWNGTDEFKRAANLDFANRRNQLTAQVREIMRELPDRFAAKVIKIRQAALKNERFADDLHRLITHYKMPIQEPVTRVYRGEMFAAPPLSGRPPREQATRGIHRQSKAPLRLDRSFQVDISRGRRNKRGVLFGRRFRIRCRRQKSCVNAWTRHQCGIPKRRLSVI